MINVVIISSDETVQQLLAEQDDMHISVVAPTSLDETVESVRLCSPNIIVMEQEMEHINVDILCHFLSNSCPDAQNLILTEHPPTLEMLQNSGFKARGYLSPEQKPLIGKAVRVIHDGEAWLPRKLVAEMLTHFSSSHSEMFAQDLLKLRVIK
ncbi:MAG: hypothetical protein GQ548_04085 [Methylophaga sp.]|nr:hypothetical protein [Methylophaga sp.]